MMMKKKKLSFDTCTEILYGIVQEKLSVSKHEILSIKKTRTLADTRRAMMKVLKTEFPYAKVTKLGNAVSRDHSSVSIQLKKHDELIAYKNEYTSLFNIVNKEFMALTDSGANYTLSELYEYKTQLEDNLQRVKLGILELEKKILIVQTA